MCVENIGVDELEPSEEKDCGHEERSLNRSAETC